jgi:hypothetical protein
MVVWFVLAVLLLAAFLLVRLQRWRRRLRPADAGAEPRTLFTLRQGDIVQVEARDWVVEDRLLYDEEGYQWLEYLVRDGADRRWLTVEEDDWLEVGWLETAPAGLLDTLPAVGPTLPPRLEWQGIAYRLRESGRATLTAAGRTMNRRPGRCRYGDYEGDGDRLLSIELWGEDGRTASAGADVEVTLGRRIDPGLVGILPGDGRSVYR